MFALLHVLHNTSVAFPQLVTVSESLWPKPVRGTCTLGLADQDGKPTNHEAFFTRDSQYNSQPIQLGFT